MSDLSKPLHGEVFQPGKQLPVATPGAPLRQVGGPAFWVKWRYKSAREKAESYTQFLRSLTDTVTATDQLERAIEQRDVGLARLERLGDLREAEHHRIDAEIESVRANLAAQRLTTRASLAALEEQALAAERRLARSREEQPKVKEDGVSPARRAADLIKKLRAEQAQIIKEMKEVADGTLSQADEDLIKRMELALNDRINRILEEMSGT